jgi:hypothetical protein
MMITKALVFGTSMIAFVAIAGQACAGVTISDKRYWPSEARPQATGRHPSEAFGSATPQISIVDNGHRYNGGPKSSH